MNPGPANAFYRTDGRRRRAGPCFCKSDFLLKPGDKVACVSGKSVSQYVKF